MVMISYVLTALGLNIFQEKFKNVIINVYIIQAYDSIMCGYFCIGFIDFMVKGKSLLDYTNSFSSNDYENNDKIKLKYLQ